MSPKEPVASPGILEFAKRRHVASRQVPATPVRPQPGPGLPSRIAVVGNHLPRQCGIATFTTDLCDAISAEYGSARLFAVPVNDTESGYAYPAVHYPANSPGCSSVISTDRELPKFLVVE